MSESGAWTGGDEAEVVSRLLADLQSLADLLDDHDEIHWSRWVRQSLAELQRNDARGLHRLRRAFGGMGSFNDLVLDAASVEARQRENRTLDALRTHIFSSGIALLR